MIICGIDEAGRGPLAGPVIAAAVILPAFFDFIPKDSKSISEKKRNFLFFRIINECLVGVGWADVYEIDRLNILNASLLAMKRAVFALPVKPDLLLIDGNKKIPNMKIEQKTIVKGDSKEPAISAASIIAKVIRDEIMINYSIKYPEYNFISNKGYPTKEHKEAVEKYGIIAIHRRSFSPVSKKLL